MTEDEIFARLCEIVKENATEELDWDQIDRNSKIEALGFDSLSVLDLLYDVGQAFDIEVDPSKVVDKRTIGEIVTLLKEHGV